MNLLAGKILALRDESKVPGLCRFFRTGPGEYGEGDRFLGIPVPATRKTVKECGGETDLSDLEECILSPYHEMRLAALLALIRLFRKRKKEPCRQEECIDFYLRHLDRVNNWDLVDLSCYELLGTWLLTRDRTLLYRLAESRKTVWEPRIGIVSTMQFLRHGETMDTFRIAEKLLTHPHDLLHKAAGWLLREMGKRDLPLLKRFLDLHGEVMPRTMLRYAIERFPEEERLILLKKSRKDVHYRKNKKRRI